MEEDYKIDYATDELVKEIFMLHHKIDEVKRINNSIISLLTDFVEYNKAPQYFLDKIENESKERKYEQ